VRVPKFALNRAWSPDVTAAAALSIQRSRVQVPSSPPFFHMLRGREFGRGLHFAQDFAHGEP
jgi:hypothetical protein